VNDREIDHRRQKKNNQMERHAQTGLTLLAVMLLGWVGLTTQETQVRVAELTVKVAHLRDAFNAPATRVDDLTRRIERLEREHLIQEARQSGSSGAGQTP